MTVFQILESCQQLSTVHHSDHSQNVCNRLSHCGYGLDGNVPVPHGFMSARYAAIDISCFFDVAKAS